MMNNIDKALEGRGDLSEKDSLLKLAEKDPFHNIELELTAAIEEAYEEAKKDGFKGTVTDWLKATPVSELKKLALRDGGPVDFSNMDVGTLKAIFRSENGRDPKSTKELIRGVKMYFKNMDLKGMNYE